MLHPVLLILAGVLCCQVLASSNRLPEGQKYEVVFPQKLHTQHKRDTQSNYPDVVHYGLVLEGKPLVLQLKRTEGLISDDYTETLYLPDGTPITHSPKIQDHCYYHGHVENDDDSMASVSTCRGLSGVIHTRSRRFLIEPLNATDSDEHAVYEDKDETPKTCGVTNTTWLDNKVVKSSRSSNIEKQLFYASQKFVKMYVVLDTTMFKKYNRSEEYARIRVSEIINYVNLVYKIFNTFVAITGMEIWKDKDLFDMSSDASQLLSRFTKWRETQLLPRKPNDNAQLITNIDFDGATVGLAFMGTMCTTTHSAGVIQDHSKPSISVGATVAHEMGHNLGMSHDSSSCSCDAESCIMAPSLSYNTPKYFSTCSKENFQKFIYDKMPVCMKVEPEKTVIQIPAVCGNKFTEVGEECDCGTVEECTNLCCNAQTCKLQANAKCAAGECCDNCQIRNAGHVCRPIKDDCDLADMCDGKSAACPSDRFRVNGFPCMNGQGHCYNGKCPSLLNQCISLWGASAQVAQDSCFEVNRRGLNYGYCKKSGNVYMPCAKEDVKCGVLYCFGGSSSADAVVAEFSNCKGVLAQKGMVENGTKCGDGMVCLNAECTTIETAYRSADCSAKCTGHAVCDHELKCQCEEGWSLPTCDAPSSTNIIIIVVVVLISLALIIGLVLLVIFRRRSIRRKQSSVPTVSGATNQAFVTQYHSKKQQVANSSTPEMTTRNLLQTPPPPTPPQKPTVSRTAAGYQGPQYSVASTKVVVEKEDIKKPTTAPPPIPTKPALPPQLPQALKPPVKV